MEAVHNPKVALTPIADYMTEGLLALVPYYKSEYKSVVLTRKSSYPDKRAVSWLVRTVATYYQMDINLMRKRYGKMLNLRNNFSLAFTQYLVLMPVKLREATEPGENTIGYVSVSEIKTITDPPVMTEEATPWRSAIIFKNGRRLLTLNIVTTLWKRMRQSKEVLADYQKLNGNNTDKRSMCREALLDQLPNCNCVLLDMFLKELGLEKDAVSFGAKDSLPAPSPRLSPDLLRRKPGIND